MDQADKSGAFLLSAGADSHAVVLGPRGKGKSVMPDYSGLTIGLAERAFKMIDRDDLHVSAALSVDNPEGLRAFGEFQSILLMAYREGQDSNDAQAAESGEPDELFAPDSRTAERRTRDFWTDLIASVSDEHRVVARGSHFVAHLFGSPGFGGEAYRVTWLDVQRPPIVCSLSCQGDIPDAFREQLPNNALIQAIPSLRGIGPIEAGVQLAALLDGLANLGGARDSTTR